MLYGFKKIAASLAAVCLATIFTAKACDSCGEHHVSYHGSNGSNCASCVANGTAISDYSYNFSLDTQSVDLSVPVTVETQTYATTYSREPGLSDFSVSNDLFAYGPTYQRTDFAYGVYPPSADGRGEMVQYWKRDSGCPPGAVQTSTDREQAGTDTSYDPSAQLDRESAVGSSADSADVYRQRVDRNRYFSRDDVRDDNRDVDPTFGRGATFYNRTDFNSEVRRDIAPRAYFDSSVGSGSRRTTRQTRRVTSTTLEPGYDTTRSTTSGAGAGRGSGGVSQSELEEAETTSPPLPENQPVSNTGRRTAGDVSAETYAGVPSSVQSGTTETIPGGTGAGTSGPGTGTSSTVITPRGLSPNVNYSGSGIGTTSTSPNVSGAGQYQQGLEIGSPR